MDFLGVAMTKIQVLKDLIKLTTRLQKLAVELIDQNEYDNVTIVMDEVIAKLKAPVTKNLTGSFTAVVGKDSIVMDLGENGYQPLFEEKNAEN